MKVQTSLELANHEVVVGISLDTLDGEAANPGVDLAGQHLGLGVAGLKIEGLLAVEGKDLGRRHNVAAVENGQAGVLVGDVGRLLPGEFDGVVDDIVNGEVTHTEDGGEDGTAESTAASNGLILVKGEREGLAEELGDGVLDGGHTGAATNHLDEVNVLGLELGLSQGFLNGNGDPVQKGLDHGLELLTLNDGADVDVLHQRLNAHGSSRVGRQDLLHLLGSGQGTRPGLGVRADIDLELLLELIGEVLGQGTVEVATTEVTVVGSSLDVELTLAELDDGGSVVAVADIDEHDPTGLLLRAGQVELSDTVTESGGGGVVDQAENLEASDFTGIEHGAALDVGEPSGNADSDVGDRKLQLLGGDVPDLGQVHGDQLSSRELLLLSEVADLGTGLAIDIAKLSRGVLLLDRNIGVAECAADQALQVADRVLEVGSLLRLSGLTESSAAGIEANKGTVWEKNQSVHGWVTGILGRAANMAPT